MKPLALALAMLTTACVSSSIATDERRVRELTQLDEVVRVANLRVEAAPSEDAQGLLKAPLTAASAVRVALLNNRELRATLREMGIPRGKLMQAGLLPNPVVEAELLPDRDFALMTHEFKLDVGARRPDPTAMNDFNVLTFNSKAFPGTAPLVVGTGERVRIRLGNLSPMDHHPIHLHGLAFEVTATDGGEVPRSARYPETTVLVPVGSTRVIEFQAEEPGDWAMHCHMTHHVMTQMGHGLPPMTGTDTNALDQRMRRVLPAYMSMGSNGMGNMAEMEMPIPDNSLPMRGGMGPFSYIDMGGMFTVLKVRDNPDASDPNAWYEHPAGTVAGPADAERMRKDGIPG